MTKRRYIAAASLAAAALALSACSGTPAAEETTAAPAETDYYPITVTDMAGNEVTIESADKVGVTDNRFFQVAANWDLPVVTAPLGLFSDENPLKDDPNIADIGDHGEPDFEKIVEADPDVIINGYRFGGDTAQGVIDAAPEAAFIDMNVPEDSDMTVDEYVTESLTLMGEVFNKKDEAEDLIAEFHDALDKAKESYNPDTKVMGLITSGGEISYSNPTDGRGASVFFNLLDLTPALDAEGSDNHTGDSVSLETLAGANADVFIVLDRDAAVGEGEVTPALELINSSAALSAVPAVENEAIYVFPADYYLTEDVYAYITVLNGLIEVFDAQK